MHTWVVDVGGTTAKRRAGLVRPGAAVQLLPPEVAALETGPGFTPEALCDWLRDGDGLGGVERIVLGLPGPVRHGGLVAAPPNLGVGWLDFDFEAALGCAVTCVNDAAMAALGHWTGPRLLFLGLGTGLGTAVIDDEGRLLDLELGHLPYEDASYEAALGSAGRDARGHAAWCDDLARAIGELGRATIAEEIVLGGGLTAHLGGALEQLALRVAFPVRAANPDAAFLGGLRHAAQRPVGLPGGPVVGVALRAAAASTLGRSAHEALEGTKAETWLYQDGLAVDLGKQGIPAAGWKALGDLAEACGVDAGRAQMFSGAALNGTEGRAVLHVALRAPDGADFEDQGRAVMPEIQAVRDRMLAFATRVRSGEHAGQGGAFEDVVHIGIGGSDLGPRLVCAALRPFADGPRVHFVSNVDPAHLDAVLEGLDPTRTLVVVASKTFNTQETLQNATRARAWVAQGVSEAALGAHLVALSAATERARDFGVPEEQVFGFWDFVVGRYSLWSSIGLPIALSVGDTAFRALLAGAHRMDEHFRNAALRENQPVMLALAGVWQRMVMRRSGRAVVPYAQDLGLLPAWLQQLDMESNGKGVDRAGRALAWPSCPIVFGQAGTDAQHAFFQLVHQGTEIVPVEFVLVADGPGDVASRRMLLANALAQGAALLEGRGPQAASDGHRVFPGSRPSTTILMDRLDPERLGALLALHEHRVFVEGMLYGVNPFDQFGVELGKAQARSLLPLLETDEEPQGVDHSTARILAQLRTWMSGDTGA